MQGVYPLYAAGEEGMVERSNDRVSRRSALKFRVRDGSVYRPLRGASGQAVAKALLQYERTARAAGNAPIIEIS